MVWTIIGISAAALTTFGFIPQLTRMFKTKSVSDISLVMLLQLSCGVFFWMLYGIHLRNPIMIVANGVMLLTLFLALFLYARYRKAVI